MSDVKIVRFGIVGTGGIAGEHALAISKVEGAKLVAVQDIEPGRAEAFAQSHGGARVFADYRKMIQSGAVDALCICTPHSSHPDIAITAVKKGVHVLCEKPMAVGVREARAMAEVSLRHPAVKFAVNFQLRSAPIFRKVKELIAGGRMGKLFRATWIATDWFRTQHYYDRGGWRGTWAGAGGGVLLNQCPHQLDIYQWLVGMPNRVWAFAALGKYHKVEVEDDVTAYLEYDNGMTGQFIATTGEWPGSNRLEISADRGRLLIEGRKLYFDEAECSVSEYSAAPSKERIRRRGMAREEIAVEGEGGRHADMVQNLVDAITRGTPLIASAADSVAQLELGNAITLAGITRKMVPLPLNGNAYARFLKRMRCAQIIKPLVGAHILTEKAKSGQIVAASSTEETPPDAAPPVRADNEAARRRAHPAM